MHHHTKVGYKRFSSSESIIQLSGILNAQFDLDLKQSKSIFSLDVLIYNLSLNSLVAKEWLVLKIQYTQSYFDYISPQWEVALKTATYLFCTTPRLMMLHDHATFGYRRSSGSEDIRTTPDARPDVLILTYPSLTTNKRERRTNKQTKNHQTTCKRTLKLYISE